MQTEPVMMKIAHEYSDRPDFYFIARGNNYPIALEGALKLKELSYIHAEGMNFGAGATQVHGGDVTQLGDAQGNLHASWQSQANQARAGKEKPTPRGLHIVLPSQTACITAAAGSKSCSKL